MTTGLTAVRTDEEQVASNPRAFALDTEDTPDTLLMAAAFAPSYARTDKKSIVGWVLIDTGKRTTHPCSVLDVFAMPLPQDANAAPSLPSLT